MDYYEKIKRAYTDIDNEIKANLNDNLNTNIEILAFKITKRYGLSEKLTRKYIDKLEKLNIVTIDRKKDVILMVVGQKGVLE